MNGEKKFYLSKTFWFNVIVLIVAVAGVFGFAEYVPGQADQEQINAVAALVAAAVPVVNIILRFMTSSKIRL